MSNNDFYNPYQQNQQQYQQSNTMQNQQQYQQPDIMQNQQQYQQPGAMQNQQQYQQPGAMQYQDQYQYQTQYQQQNQLPQMIQPQQQGAYQNPYPPFVQPLTPEYSISAYRTYLSKMESAATLWLIIGILQIIIGVFTAVFFWGFVLIGIGIWNIVQSNNEKKAVKHFRQTSSGITRYVDSQSSGIGALLVNIFLGAWLGIIAAAMDMSARNYGHNNRMALREVEQNGWK